jgi:DNA polymerase elongation subunit (family B)
VFLFTWDSEGNRITEEWDYKPYLMVEDKKGDHKSIYGTTLKKREFSSNFDRNKFIEDSGIKRIFENLPPYQQFLIDNYWHSCENEDFSQFPLKICYIDIENPDPTVSPDVETANTVVNLLTCYDSLTKIYTMFGLKPFDKGREDVDYHYCKTEKELLKKFVNHFSSDFCDVLCGWNSNGYDIPYLIRRITNILGKEWADELSPVGRIYEKINKAGKFGKGSTEYVIEGISCLDYIVLYSKFKMDNKPEDMKLDTVGEHELKKNKVAYDGSLWDLSINDWDTYCLYNLQDVELLVDLDAKLQYISLIRFLSYNGLVNLDKAVDTLPVVNGAVAIRARNRGEYISTFRRPQREGKNPGGLVQESKTGHVRNVVTFDANSLYPSIMISLNISPETKLGRVEKIGDDINIHHTSGRVFKLNKESFHKFLKVENASISKSNHLFTQNKKGLMPEFLDGLYTKRQEMKKAGKSKQAFLNENRSTMTENEIASMESEIQRCDTYQHSYKILLNSMYGYMGNPYAPMGDDDMAASVTLTGQAINTKNKELFMKYLTDNYGFSDTESENSCIAGDTDSGMFSLQYLEKRGIPLKDGNGDISKEFLDICDSIEKYINDNISEWVVNTFRSKDSRIVYKREVIADAGVFLKKKHYVLHILDDEGLKVDKFKYKGVEVVTGKMPKAIKPYVKEVIESLILDLDLKKSNEIFNEAYEVFKTLPYHSICHISGMNNYEEYSSKCDGLKMALKMPPALKAAYRHDYVVKQLNLGSKYPKFKSGDKVRYLQLKTPNKYNMETIAFHGQFPKEFEEIFIVDKEKMFNKIFFAAIERFYEAVKWVLRKPSENLRVELDDLFGE